ncbi:MAG: hypothetical protein QN120_04140 [Armatimonadota bacterium]|nr:hypothetical protein [Armatimonadota bacterium]
MNAPAARQIAASRGVRPAAKRRRAARPIVPHRIAAAVTWAYPLRERLAAAWASLRSAPR